MLNEYAGFRIEGWDQARVLAGGARWALRYIVHNGYLGQMMILPSRSSAIMTIATAAGHATVAVDAKS